MRVGIRSSARPCQGKTQRVHRSRSGGAGMFGASQLEGSTAERAKKGPQGVHVIVRMRAQAVELTAASSSLAVCALSALPKGPGRVASEVLRVRHRGVEVGSSCVPLCHRPRRIGFSAGAPLRRRRWGAAVLRKAYSECARNEPSSVEIVSRRQSRIAAELPRCSRIVFDQCRLAPELVAHLRHRNSWIVRPVARLMPSGWQSSFGLVR